MSVQIYGGMDTHTGAVIVCFKKLEELVFLVVM